VRVILVGRPADRDRLRPQLVAAGIDIVSEQAHAPDGAAPPAGVDAIVQTTPGMDSRYPFPESSAASAASVESSDPDPLTARELDVLALLAEGLPNKAIAASLGISDQTVKFHVASIIGKLGAANRTDAVRRAVRRGLVAL
jgi:DNA-binding NarL/FixJ family response regulator